MPVWEKHNRLVVRGTLGDTEEIWSNTLHFKTTITAAPDNKPSDWDQTAVTAAINGFYGSSNFSSDVHVVGWRGYQIGTNGHLIGDEMVRIDYGTRTSGGSSLVPAPQLALVLSLHAPSRGSGQRGRIYLPMCAFNVMTSDLMITSGAASTILAAFKTYIEALKDAMYASDVIGESLINAGSGPIVGRNQDVTEYRCGRVIDTIRNRRNQLLENYVTLAA